MSCENMSRAVPVRMCEASAVLVIRGMEVCCFTRASSSRDSLRNPRILA